MLLVFTIVWSTRKPEEEDVSTTPTPSAPWSYFSSDVEGLLLEDQESEMVVEIVRDPEAIWTMVQPNEGPLEPSSVEMAVGWLASPTPYRILTGTSDLSQYGLDEPSHRVTVFFSDGSTRVLLVGNNAPTGNRTYVMVPGSGDVIIVNSFSIDPILELANLDVLVTPMPEEGLPEETATAEP